MMSDMTDMMYANNGMPIVTKIKQKSLPLLVSGEMFPYPIVVANVPAKKKEL